MSHSSWAKVTQWILVFKRYFYKISWISMFQSFISTCKMIHYPKSTFHPSALPNRHCLLGKHCCLLLVSLKRLVEHQKTCVVPEWSIVGDLLLGCCSEPSWMHPLYLQMASDVPMCLKIYSCFCHILVHCPSFSLLSTFSLGSVLESQWRNSC